MQIGLIGAGMIGSTLAKLWVDAGHEVMLSSRHPDELRALADRIGDLASVGTPAEAARYGETVLLTVPLGAVPQLAAELAPLVARKVVLDTGNAYENRDGAIAREATAHPRGSAGWAAAQFPGARWVKAFNTVYFKVMEIEAHREGDRIGIPLASDDRDALDVAAALVRDAGFDPVIVGPLARGREFEPGTPCYNTAMTGADLRRFFPPA
ncbi:MAG: NADPH-dependent F420 reductase [Acidobacteria bacterium]|nr:NADPH-dependent F420 reductase [Acidobacteriota bacterium]